MTKCVLMRPTKIMVPSKRRTLKYVVFPQRQPYFTYGDLHFSGLANLAFQVSILQCKIWRYSDFLKMGLKPMEFEYFCITWLQLWQNYVSCDHQTFMLLWKQVAIFKICCISSAPTICYLWRAATKVAATHLALRSPMFGEHFILIFTSIGRALRALERGEGGQILGFWGSIKLVRLV